jgi:hypothetical protein
MDKVQKPNNSGDNCFTLFRTYLHAQTCSQRLPHRPKAYAYNLQPTSKQGQTFDLFLKVRILLPFLEG